MVQFFLAHPVFTVDKRWVNSNEISHYIGLPAGDATRKEHATTPNEAAPAKNWSAYFVYSVCMSEVNDESDCLFLF